MVGRSELGDWRSICCNWNRDTNFRQRENNKTAQAIIDKIPIISMSSDYLPRCVILGAGGHAGMVVESIQANADNIEINLLDPNRSFWGQTILNVKVLGDDKLLPELVQDGITHFVIGVGGTGDNSLRRRLFDLCLEHGLTPLVVCHPSAVRSPSAQVGPGTVVLPNAVVNTRSILGSNVIVNTGAIIEHDCAIGDHVHIATGSRLCATVQVGDTAHIGAGATVRQSLAVGEGAIIGAGAVVVNDVPPWTTVVGSPAKAIQR